MIVVARDVGEVTVLDLTGPLIMGHGDRRLRGEITRLLNHSRRWVVLNFAEVPYIDSAGVGELLSCHVRLQAAGGDVKLLNLGRRVSDLLELSQLLDHFETYRDETTAIAACTPSSKPSAS